MRRIVRVAVLLCLSATVLPAAAVPPVLGGALASSNIDYVATIPDVEAIGAKIVDGYMYVTTVNGLRIYDVRQGMPIPMGVLNLPHFENEAVDTNGEIALISADGFVLGGTVNVLIAVDVRNKNAPLVRSVTVINDGHTATCVEDCTFAFTSGGDIVDLRDPAAPVSFTDGYLPVGSHNWNVDSAGIGWGGGAIAFDTNGYDGSAAPTFLPYAGPSFGWHNSIRPNASSATVTSLADGDIDRGEVLIAADEDLYNFFGTSGNCNGDGQVDTTWVRRVGNNITAERLDQWNVGRNGTLPNAKPIAATFCSSHWLDERDGLVAVAWYEQGIRILDVSNPRDITQVGYFMPAETQAWAAYFNQVADGPFGGGLYVYTTDLVRGIDVFKVNATAGASATVLAPRLNPGSPALAPSEEYGYACRVRAGSTTLS